MCVCVQVCVWVFCGSRLPSPPLILSFSSSCSYTHTSLKSPNIYYSPHSNLLIFLHFPWSETRRSGRLASPRDRRRVNTRIEEFGRGLSARVGRKTRVWGERSAPDTNLLMFWFIYDVGDKLLLRFHAWVDVNTYVIYMVLIMLLVHPTCLGNDLVGQHVISLW